MKLRKAYWGPLIMGLGVLLLDQVTKFLVVRFIPVNTIGASFLNGFFRIIHVRNTGVAFSLGDSFPAALRMVIFGVLPLVVLVLLGIYYLRTEDLSRLQRYAVGGILGGGLGNIIDRLFRPAGVVDFLDVRFYGIFGWERWPTFNVADSCVVISVLLLLLSFLLEKRPKGDEEKKEQDGQ